MRKAFNFYISYYEVFKELPDKDKVHFITALLERQFEGIEPNNLSGMAKFAYISQKHSIDAQVAGYEAKANKKLTPTEGGRQGGTEGACLQEKEKGKEKGKEERAFNFGVALLENGVSKIHADDWLDVRKKRKAVNSITAFKKFENECKKSGLTMDEVVGICAANSWQGFSASWGVVKDKKNNTKKLKTYDQIEDQL